jgi:membrane protease YdiL (CAAX protease family)
MLQLNRAARVTESVPEPEWPLTRSDRLPDEEWRTILRMSLMLFGVSILLACGASLIFRVPLFDQPFSPLSDSVAGFAATLPLLAGLLVLRSNRGWLSKKLWDVPAELLGPALSRSKQPGLIGIALMAGVGEELLFRGLLQNWLLPWGILPALIIPNVLFGVLHWVNAAYAVAAGITGLYFALLVQFVPEVSLYSLMLGHAFYDYVALNCLAARSRYP